MKEAPDAIFSPVFVHSLPGTLYETSEIVENR